MGFYETAKSKGFSDLTEGEQVSHLRQNDSSFAAAYERNQGGALELLREATPSRAAEGAEGFGGAVGSGVRALGSGFGSSMVDMAQAPLDIAAYMGSDTAAAMSEVAEEAQARLFPALPEDASFTDKMAFRVGEYGAIGATFFAGGAFAAGTKLPGIARVGEFLIAGGLRTEMATTAASAVAGVAIEEVTDDPWARLGAEMLAGFPVAAVVGARTMKKFGSAAVGEQPSKAGALDPRAAADIARKQKQEGVQLEKWKQQLSLAEDSLEGAKARHASTPTQAAAKTLTHTQGRVDRLRAKVKKGEAGQPVRDVDDASRDVAEGATSREMDQMLRDADDAAQQLPPGATPTLTKDMMDETWELESAGMMKYLSENSKNTRVSRDTWSRFVGAGKNMMIAAGIKRDNRFDMVQQIGQAYKQMGPDTPEAVALMAEAGITKPEFAASIMGWNAREAARDLGALGNASKQLERMGLTLTPQELAEAKAIGGPLTEGLGLWQRLENVRRGLLVTQLATAVRNGLTQVGNIGVHTVEDVLEAGVLKMFGAAAREAHPTNAFGTAGRLAGMLRPGKSRTFRQTEQLNEMFEKQMSPMFAHYSSEVPEAFGPAGAMHGAEWLTWKLNAFNRLQEWGIRRAVFTSELDRVLSVKGQSLAKLEAKNMLGSLDPTDIKSAVAKSLEATWAKPFDPTAKGAEGLAGTFIKLINGLRFGPFAATQLIPFPRFMMNSFKWQYEHSPLPLMKAAFSPDDWKKIAGGDIKPLIKGSMGMGMFATAMEIRESQPEHTRWYEYDPQYGAFAGAADAMGIQKGEFLDMRAFNPFVSYLFAADLLKKYKEDRLHKMSVRDIAMGIASVNLRAGAGMYVLDKALTGLVEAKDSVQDADSMKEMLSAVEGGAEGYLGSAWSGLFVPFQQVTDVYDSYKEFTTGQQAVVRDTSAEPLAGAAKRRFPEGAANLPEVELATREAPPVREMPWLRQLAGMTVKSKKNPAEETFDRLQFTRSDILPTTGIDEWDRAVAKEMGPLVEKATSDYVQQPGFLRLDLDLQEGYLRKHLKDVAAAARRVAQAKHPELWQQVRLKGLPAWKKRTLKKITRKAGERQERLEAGQ